MRSINDEVKDDAQNIKGKNSGTIRGLELLRLKYDPDNYSVANKYIAALSVINELLAELEWAKLKEYED